VQRRGACEQKRPLTVSAVSARREISAGCARESSFYSLRTQRRGARELSICSTRTQRLI